jgi:hypothetical protein
LGTERTHGKHKRQRASMTMGLIVLVAVSWLVSAYLAVRLWRARENAMLKCALTAVLFIPALGPLFFLWIATFRRRCLRSLWTEVDIAPTCSTDFGIALKGAVTFLLSREIPLRALLMKSMSGSALSKAGKRGGQKNSSVDGSSMHASAEKRSEPRYTSPTMRCSRSPRRRGSG